MLVKMTVDIATIMELIEKAILMLNISKTNNKSINQNK